MQIPKELVVKWKSLRSRGDNKKLNAMLENPLPAESAIIVFARALNREQCPDHIFKVLNKFYTAKELELFPPTKTQISE